MKLFACRLASLVSCIPCQLSDYENHVQTIRRAEAIGTPGFSLLGQRGGKVAAVVICINCVISLVSLFLPSHNRPRRCGCFSPVPTLLSLHSSYTRRNPDGNNQNIYEWPGDGHDNEQPSPDVVGDVLAAYIRGEINGIGEPPP